MAIKIVSALLLTLLVAITAAEVVLQEGVRQRVTIPSYPHPREVVLRFDPNMVVNAATLVIYPCFGAISWYMEVGSIPNATHNSCDWLWQPDFYSANCTQFGLVNTDVYTLVQAPNEYSRLATTSGIFDVVIVDEDNEDEYLSKVPVPGADGVVEIDLNDDETVATVKWTATANLEDQYEVYQFVGSSFNVPDGFLSYSACGIQEFMKRIATMNATSASQAMEIEVDDLEPTQVTTFAVVATNPGGYMRTYTPSKVGEGAMLTPFLSLYFIGLVLLLIATIL